MLLKILLTQTLQQNLLPGKNNEKEQFFFVYTEASNKCNLCLRKNPIVSSKEPPKTSITYQKKLKIWKIKNLYCLCYIGIFWTTGTSQ